MPEPEALLQVDHLTKYYPITRGLLQRVKGYVKAVDDVSLSINRGETMGLVGESGCGKTTIGRCVLRAVEPTAGEIKFRAGDGAWIDLNHLNQEELRSIWTQMQLIFQDPYSSLNPRRRIFELVGEPLMAHQICKENDLKEQVAGLLEMVGLRPEHMMRYPHAFSGGQRQRIGIARALALNPSFIVCDEPVSALDVSVQAQVLNLLRQLQVKIGLTYLFISHDLSVVEHISDRVAVMYVGKMVEVAPTEELYHNPLHPYTEALLSAVPRPDPTLTSRRIILAGDVANPSNPPSGCYFHPRCRYQVERCRVEMPSLVEFAPGHFTACHRAGEITLSGV